jgi:hypothetical protein
LVAVKMSITGITRAEIKTLKKAKNIIFLINLLANSKLIIK